MPPNAHVMYEIELLSIEDLPSLSAMPVCERLRLRYVLLHRSRHFCVAADTDVALAELVSNSWAVLGKGLDTCYSATYMSQTRDQQRFTISEVGADWHEPVVPQRIMWQSIARANGQLDLRFS